MGQKGKALQVLVYQLLSKRQELEQLVAVRSLGTHQKSTEL